ncbi:hypothetical protein DAPPUDRAFT_113270 [Daphnia pulex]|uniref:Uncharacterized protein n=1 Tax=Daphnia pulex TaxID=6669 RepID=E9HEJ3_DAPPU|nr:hypothetical protein DAPPUDRAFT_113270 [Daphnia pulex]|eukprot:EFX69868.1 hypothetical protein DAPPUDRAFT_113270 [Daphnia pulex]
MTFAPLVMANGEQATLMGAATISVNHKMGTATGESVVFRMDGIDLILGNDFLKQYGKVQIDYREPTASINFGDQALAAITPQRTDHTKRGQRGYSSASFIGGELLFRTIKKTFRNQRCVGGTRVTGSQSNFRPVGHVVHWSTSVWIPVWTLESADTTEKC